MNENELKELWNSEKPNNLPKINFEQVQENISIWQSKLRRKIKFDVIASFAIVLTLIPLSFRVPNLVYFIPIVLLMMGWGYLQMWKIYKLENQSYDYKSTKEFLEKKSLLLQNYMRKSRIIGYTLNPLIILAIFSVQATFKELYEHIVQLISILVFLEVFVIVFSEIYFRIMYIPTIKRSKELLEQLESETK